MLLPLYNHIVPLLQIADSIAILETKRLVIAAPRSIVAQTPPCLPIDRHQRTTTHQPPLSAFTKTTNILRRLNESTRNRRPTNTKSTGSLFLFVCRVHSSPHHSFTTYQTKRLFRRSCSTSPRIPALSQASSVVPGVVTHLLQVCMKTAASNLPLTSNLEQRRTSNSRALYLASAHRSAALHIDLHPTSPNLTYTSLHLLFLFPRKSRLHLSDRRSSALDRNPINDLLHNRRNSSQFSDPHPRVRTS